MSEEPRKTNDELVEDFEDCALRVERKYSDERQQARWDAKVAVVRRMEEYEKTIEIMKRDHDRMVHALRFVTHGGSCREGVNCMSPLNGMPACCQRHMNAILAGNEVPDGKAG